MVEQQFDTPTFKHHEMHWLSLVNECAQLHTVSIGSVTDSTTSLRNGPVRVVFVLHSLHRSFLDDDKGLTRVGVSNADRIRWSNRGVGLLLLLLSLHQKCSNSGAERLLWVLLWKGKATLFR